MARRTLKKAETKVLASYCSGNLSTTAAMKKLQIKDYGTFYRLFHHYMMAPRVDEF